MKIIDENYSTFLNEEILSLPSYNESTKKLSFSFRDGKENQDVFAYASLKKDDVQGFKGHGVRILEMKNTQSMADDRFFDRLYSIIKYWITDSSVRQFDYLWFIGKDISKEYIDRLCKYINFEYCETQGLYVCYVDIEISNQ